ncbi:MAG: 30S ribosomal protein S12 methylthiotransferase RimO [Balneolales bacterium]
MRTRIPHIYVDTLGCSKNQVDSEVFIAQAKANEFKIVNNLDEADVLVINTCGFIEDAKKESIDHIMEGIALKEQGKLDRLLVMGCLSDRYMNDLKSDIPEVDQYFGSSHTSLPQVLQELGGRYRKELVGERMLTNPSHYAYLKISEGCDHTCSFCAIPIMRGGHVSRPVEELVSEAQKLKSKGVRELILIGQDLTWYGLDLYGKRILSDLLKRLSDIGFDWIRLQYAYPAKFPMDILPVIRERDNICNYLDMPVQHCHTEILKSMRRGLSGNSLRELLHHIRDEVPGIRLRTTLIVGYPTESRAYFEELLDFVREFRFERLGCFAYSQEEATIAWDLGDPVPGAEKQRRVQELMALQETISREHNEALIGQVLPVMIDRIENGTAYGRTEWDTPEVDNEVIIQQAMNGFHPHELHGGSLYDVHITDAEAFDLFGTIASIRKDADRVKTQTLQRL